MSEEIKEDIDEVEDKKEELSTPSEKKEGGDQEAELKKSKN